MENTTHVTPKDFFLNLGWLITLYGSVISILNLLFETINRAFPDNAVNAYYSYGYSGAIRWSIAWLIVLFPIYIIITKYINRMIVVEPLKKDLWIRRWFVYLTLFLSSSTIVVDIIVLINGFLGGELTSRFGLKVLATLLVAGFVLGYYFYDLKKETRNDRLSKVFTIGSLLLVLASLIWAFTVIGSPMQERLRKFDDQRVQHLNDIQSRIITYWQAKGTLPKNLSESEDSIYGSRIPVDPETNEQYEYKIIDQKSFELCANFNLESRDGASEYYYGITTWKHEKGRVCFKKSIDKDLYPVRSDINVPVKY